MTAVGLLLALGPPGVAAWGLTRLLGLRPRGSPPVALAGALAFAALIGLGISSVSTFAWLLGGGTLGVSFAAADLAVFGSAALWLVLRARRVLPAQADEDASAAPRESRPELAALVLALAAAVAVTVALGVAAPHGEMDAWMMWNMKARFLFRAGAAWRTAFAPELGWTSPEYPLLLPLAIARVWAYTGETQLAPAALASLFTAAAPLALAAGILARASASRAALAGLLLVAAPGFLGLGGSQYADVPLAAYLVAAVAALELADARGAPARGRAVAGLLLGCAGWTKNEGVLAAAIVFAVAVISDLAAHGARTAARRALLLSAGAAAPAAAWLAFHGAVTARVTGVLFMGHTPETIARRLGDGGRWGSVVSAMTERLPGAHVGYPLAVLAFAALVAWRARAPPRSRALAIAPALLAAHAIVFVLTTWDLDWHLGLAADRLILQTWPLVLLALFAGREGARAPAVRPSG